MSLFDKISENQLLHFVDENDPDHEFKFSDLRVFSFPVKEKELIFLYLDNSLASISCFFSALKSPHGVVMLSLGLNQTFKTELEKIYSPAFIIDKTRNDIRGYVKGYDFFERKEKVRVFIHPEIKILLSTSGTTGSPKFVKLSDENLLSNARAITSYLPIKSSDVTPLNLPVYYSYGLSVLTSNALKGGKIVCGNTDVLNRAFWNNMDKFGYTSIAGVPFVYEMLDRIGFTKKDYPSLAYFTQAGGKLQDHLVKKFSEYALSKEILFFVMYGQTEATARMSYLPPGKLQDKVGSIGIAIPEGKLFISEENKELCYEGPNVFGGYVTSPADLETFEHQKTLHTGDIASQDEDGYFYITGRLKRFVKLFGSRVNLDELESLLTKKFDLTCSCVGDNDKKLLIISDQLKGKENDIKTYLTDELKIHPSVIVVREVDEIPLTVNGKVNYNDILLKYAS
jgi:long-chain acyl-CoA synthetase